MQIHHALVTLHWPKALRDELADLLDAKRVTIAEPRSAAAKDALRDVDVAILGGDASRDVLNAPRLRWLHCDHAGIDGFAPSELFAGNLVVTTSAGRSASAIAEHALFFMLALSQEATRLWNAQRRRVWGLPGLEKRRCLQGRTVLIIGCGHTGRQLARYCNVVGMQVIGYRRRMAPPPSGFDEVHAADASATLPSLLKRAHVLVLASSLNDATRGLIGREELMALPKGAYLVNVARGSLVDEEALVASLQSGHLGGAGLDVAVTEPLPPNSPLWRAPRTLITPHATPQVADRARASLEIIRPLIRQYRRGEALEGRLDARDAYNSPQQTSPMQTRITRLWRRLASPG